MTEKAILFDSTECIACRACQVACKQWWELPAISTTNQGTYENPPDLSAETWNKITFKEIKHNGTVKWLFTRRSCMHCTTAVCVWVCPAYARTYDKLGFVTIDHDRCIGCGRCVAYCPFDVPRMGEHEISPRIVVELGAPKAVVYKCTFCKDRVQESLQTACAKTCPTGALQFGERADMVKLGRARVDDVRATYRKALLYGEKELGGLHVLYVLVDDPSVHGLPGKPQVETYPKFDANTFPGWYVRALNEGKLPIFPPEARREWYMQPELVPTSGQTEPAWPAEVARRVPVWAAQAIQGWFWLGIAGGVAALSWTIKRKMEKRKEKA